MSDSNHNNKHEHHILSDKMAITIFVTLLIGTIITVAVSRFDLGEFNFVVAMLVATIKAALVVLFFMGLKYDSNDNRTIFGISFIFVFIFVALTTTDIFFRRPGSYVNVNKLSEELAKAGGGPKIKIKNFWKETPEIVAHGKSLFMVNCMSCHGPEGKGDGPAAVALNPKPRNFTQDQGWINGRKSTQVFGTLTKGVNKMPSFGTLPPDDRFALALYVLSLGPKAPATTDADLKAAGIDSSKDDGGLGSGSKALPIDFAIEQMATDRG